MEQFCSLHNIELAEKKRDKALVGLWHRDVFLFKPLSYMNLSGTVVRAFTRRHNLVAEQLLILHDELDFPCGKVRFKQGGGEGGHNGLRSISTHLRSQNYWRLRIGVGKPPCKEEGQKYVLQPPKSTEQDILNRLVQPVTQSLLEFMRGDKQKAMRELHQSC